MTINCTCWHGDLAKAPPCQCHPDSTPVPQLPFMLNREQAVKLVRAARPLAALGQLLARECVDRNQVIVRVFDPEANAHVGLTMGAFIELSAAMPEIDI
jgi:hypothetical protein